MKIAVLSNASAGVLAGMLRPRHEVWIPPGWGAWAETAALPPREMLAFAPAAIFLALDPAGRNPGADGVLERAVASLESAFPYSEIFVLDMPALASETGPSFFDPRMAAVAGMPWSLAGLRAIAAEIDRFAGMLQGGVKKAVAVDFDGTLWDGVLAEDGLDGISPRPGFQKFLLSLKERGVILVALSKNTPSAVECVWSDPRMVLRKEDFSCLRIGWSEKADNLAAAARDLNISPSAFVFVDDSPAERERMKALSPGTAVPDFPVSPDGLPGFERMLSRRYFPRLRTAASSSGRAASYAAEAARRRAAEGLDPAEYLRSLDMRIDIAPARPSDIMRLAELSARCSQFNVLTSRRTAPEIAALAADPRHVVLAVRAADRFGDYGTVAFAIARIDPGARAEIVDFVMSCRAMNRRIEFSVEEALEKELSARGVETLFARRDSTPKNAPVENLFSEFGFETVRVSGPSAFYRRRLAAGPSPATSCPSASPAR